MMSEFIKKFQGWIIGAIGFLTTIITFFVFLQNNWYIGLVTIASTSILILLCGAFYVYLKKQKSPFVEGRLIYKYPSSYRNTALVLLIFTIIGSISLMFYSPSQQIITTALWGSTSTPTSTNLLFLAHTSNPTIAPPFTDTPIPTLVAPKVIIPNTISNSNVIIKTIYQGKSSSKSELIFDIILTNLSTTEITLIKFEKKWEYIRGFLYGIGTIDPIEPIAGFSLPFDLSRKPLLDPRKTESDPIYPPIILSPGDAQGPSKFSFRIQLYLTGIEGHSNADWDVIFSLAITDDNGNKIPVFADASWAELIYAR